MLPEIDTTELFTSLKQEDKDNALLAAHFVCISMYIIELYNGLTPIQKEYIVKENLQSCIPNDIRLDVLISALGLITAHLASDLAFVANPKIKDQEHLLEMLNKLNGSNKTFGGDKN